MSGLPAHGDLRVPVWRSRKSGSIEKAVWSLAHVRRDLISPDMMRPEPEVLSVSEEPKSGPDESVPPGTPEVTPSAQDEEDIGDFIARTVLEKDSAFFDG